MASKKNLFLFSMRAYTVGVGAEMKVRGQAITIRKAVSHDQSSSCSSSSSNNKEITINNGSAEENNKEVFWMRDPKTGYYIPENHFDDVDVADLRDKFLSKKHE